MRRMMERKLMKWITVLLAVCLLGSGAVLCRAATPAAGSGSPSAGNTTAASAKQEKVKKIKVKNQEYSWQTRILKKKASVVKTGVSDLTLKGQEGYLRFTAKKTQVYTFRFYDFLGKKKGTADVMFQAPDSDSPAFSFLLGIRKGNKVNESVSVKVLKTTKERRQSVVAGQSFNSKTIKIRLKKGQTLYILLGSDHKKTTGRISIQ